MTTMDTLIAEFEHAKTTGGMSLERSRVWLAHWQQQQGVKREMDVRPMDMIRFMHLNSETRGVVMARITTRDVQVRTARGVSVRIPTSRITEIRHASDRPSWEAWAVCVSCDHPVTGHVEWSPSGFPLCGGECGF